MDLQTTGRSKGEHGRSKGEPMTETEQVGALKPDRRIFQWTCEALGIEPGDALMIGDTLHADYEGARAVGMPGPDRPVFREGANHNGAAHAAACKRLFQIGG
jgi:FMN phosphatase YigB (HAD superfamily)